MRILLTFAGYRDPFDPNGVIAGQTSAGPVLTALSEESFDRAYVFADERVLGNAAQLVAEVARRYPSLETQIVELTLSDPTDYEDVFGALLRETRILLDRHKAKQPKYFVATASGTPQMQTVWFLLARSGLLPATLLKIVPTRHLRPGERAVSEIRLSLAEFPRIEPSHVDTLELASLRIRNDKLEAERDAFFRRIEVEGIIGRSHALQQALKTLLKAAATDYPILLLGETGTGKELFAALAHQRSPRARGPFIPVGCPDIPPLLLESELFGVEKRVATEVDPRPGKFETANGGTIFLDEIGDLPLVAQAKLLRVLQQHEVAKIGASKPLPVNVRIIAATNTDLKRAVSAGSFRSDLYYRLNAIPVHIPPLRERDDDIPDLVQHFLRRVPGQRRSVTPRALRILREYAWPGNVRELKHIIERLATLADHDVIPEDDVLREIVSQPTSSGDPGLEPTIPPLGMDLDAHLARLEQRYYDKAKEITHGNEAAAARLLGLNPHTLRKRLRQASRFPQRP